MRFLCGGGIALALFLSLAHSLAAGLDLLLKLGDAFLAGHFNFPTVRKFTTLPATATRPLAASEGTT